MKAPRFHAGRVGGWRLEMVVRTRHINFKEQVHTRTAVLSQKVEQWWIRLPEVSDTREESAPLWGFKLARLEHFSPWMELVPSAG